MLKFVTTKRDLPKKRTASERTHDFKEISENFPPENLKIQSERCAQCGVPFCQSGCPLQNNIPDWLYLAASGRMKEAYNFASATNNMPEICGRICPQDRLCEKACVLEQSHHGAVTIGAVEKEIVDNAWSKGWVEPIKVARELPTSVGIIGAGPAGLAAAEELRKTGYRVHVYDRYDRAGGLLVYGIPNFKLDKQVVQQRVSRLEAAGIMFHKSVNIGVDISFDELRSRHDGLLIATGVYKTRDMELSGSRSPNVLQALEYLIASNSTTKALSAQHKRVVVIGGGDTAMDCVRTAIRQGAASVTCLYRRDRENMPGSLREVQSAEEEGVQFEWLSQPVGFVQSANRVTGVRAVRTRLGQPDKLGRRLPQVIEGSEYELASDLVIKALGFEAENIPAMFECKDLKVNSDGTLSVDQQLQTTVRGVFAAGDIVRGASLVVWAIHDGREAAASLHQFLLNTTIKKIATPQTTLASLNT